MDDPGKLDDRTADLVTAIEFALKLKHASDSLADPPLQKLVDLVLFDLGMKLAAQMSENPETARAQ
ncbi:hypothetical protein [Methylobacterium radiodurans]|uniref:Uncharacterized protein n=1 Tax=Methylobacterium radiodurans TaxID=2202828 RepID=A0A2U8VN74_9HYPH|nr:hypothetical protein [Methylobacterium radiodurans]AWN35063.1 hypothetical protein DK427_04325 [Methylobacterium radiodurans]